MIGHTLGHYRIVEQIGSSGRGVVFLAEALLRSAVTINSALQLGGSRSVLTVGLSLTALLLMETAAPGAAGQRRVAPPSAAHEADAVTFSNDIAPIFFEHCVSCHRPGTVAPMSLMSYQEVRPWARAIRERVSAREMPPWSPEPGYSDEFLGDPRLSDEQVALIEQWVAEGAVRGNPADLPPMPELPVGWRLGEPDLVIEMPAPYTLRAGGLDILRKFAIPIPTSDTRYVKGLEFQPGNARVVHHANMRIDPTRASRQLDLADPEPGYEGLTPFAAEFPQGYFLGWTPGQWRPLADAAMAWVLEPGADMLLELHLMPGEQPEPLQSRIGFFFADEAPTQIPVTIRLGKQDIDIPAGAKDHLIRDRYVLPVDVEVQGIQPHAHCLARAVRGFATLPDGTRKWLLYIKDWQFDWQDFYAYANPFVLPKGTELTMEIVFDNSVGNRLNPYSPPRRVTFGQSSYTEMGDLWIQVLPRNASDLAILQSERRPIELAEDILGIEMVLAADPDQATWHDDVALLYLRFGRVAEAVAHFRETARLRPDSAAAQYNLGATLFQQGNVDEAIGHFEQALRLNPEYVQAHNNLGAALRSQGKLAEAIRHFRQALLARPDDGDVLYNLAGVLTLQGEASEAITHYRRALELQPDWPEPLTDLAWLLAIHPTLRDANQAISLAERAAGLTNRQDAAVLDALAAAYAAAGRFDQAVTTAEFALAAVPAGRNELATPIRQRLELYRQRVPDQVPR